MATERASRTVRRAAERIRSRPLLSRSRRRGPVPDDRRSRRRHLASVAAPWPKPASNTGSPPCFARTTFENLDGQHPERGSLDAWGTTIALSALTTKLRFGTLVTPTSFRHPSVLAKLVVTADHVSDGRIDLGIGAGWHEREHEAYGYPFLSASERIDVLEEQLQILMGHWGEDEFSLNGAHYTLSGLNAQPKPVQRPRTAAHHGRQRRAPQRGARGPGSPTSTTPRSRRSSRSRSARPTSSRPASAPAASRSRSRSWPARCSARTPPRCSSGPGSWPPRRVGTRTGLVPRAAAGLDRRHARAGRRTARPDPGGRCQPGDVQPVRRARGRAGRTARRIGLAPRLTRGLKRRAPDSAGTSGRNLRDAL